MTQTELALALLGMHPGGVVKVVYPLADRVVEETYRLADGTLQVQTFTTDQMTILCGGANPLESLSEADARLLAQREAWKREHMAFQRVNDDLMLKYSELQDENDRLQRELSDITAVITDLYGRLRSQTEEVQRIEDIEPPTESTEKESPDEPPLSGV